MAIFSLNRPWNLQSFWLKIQLSDTLTGEETELKQKVCCWFCLKEWTDCARIFFRLFKCVLYLEWKGGQWTCLLMNLNIGLAVEDQPKKMELLHCCITLVRRHLLICQSVTINQIFRIIYVCYLDICFNWKWGKMSW